MAADAGELDALERELQEAEAAADREEELIVEQTFVLK